MTSPDSPRLRRELLVEAQRLTLEIDQVEDELDHFHRCDLPAFRAWFADHFAGERDEIRDLEAELAEMTERHNTVVALARMHELSMKRAYRLVELEAQAHRNGDDETRARIEADRARRHRFTTDEYQAEVRARLRDHSPPARPESPPDSDFETLKTMYRQLARRLHPDLADASADPGEARWRRRFWTALQTAREGGDVATIADLDAVTRLRQMDLHELTTDDVRRARAWLARERADFADEIERARATSAWNFSTTPPAQSERRARAELGRAAAALRTEVREMRAELDSLRRRDFTPTTRGRARATRRPVTAAEQLSFFD